MFVKLVNSFYRIENGEEPLEKIFFYNKDDEEIELYNKIRVIIDYLNFDLNSRKELTSIYKRFEVNVNNNPEVLTSFKKNIEKVIIDLKELFWEEDIIFEYNEYHTLSDFFKFIKLRNKIDFNNILDKLILLVDLESTFKWNEILVFVQLSSYLNSEELTKFFEHAEYKKVKILLIDTNLPGTTLKNEIKLIIDNEYDEILLKNN